VTTLYQAHALGLIRLAVVMLGDRPAAEDVVQEAFCGLYRRWHSLADTGKALAYVRSSVINGCRTVLRRRLRQRGVDPLTGDPPGESAEAIALSTGSTRVWSAVGIFIAGADSRGLSWTADGRELAFEWEPKNVGEWPPVEERLLSLTSAGGDLLAASRRVIATTRQFKPSGSTFQVTDTQNEPVVTPDGSAIVTNAVYFQVKTKESGQAWNGGTASPSTRPGPGSSSGSSGTGRSSPRGTFSRRCCGPARRGACSSGLSPTAGWASSTATSSPR
jgi:hypothetical protein